MQTEEKPTEAEIAGWKRDYAEHVREPGTLACRLCGMVVPCRTYLDASKQLQLANVFKPIKVR